MAVGVFGIGRAEIRGAGFRQGGERVKKRGKRKR